MALKKIIITGGGTGGHIFPALSIAEGLTERGLHIHYVGAPNSMESKLVPQKGFPFFEIKSGAIKNQNPIKILNSLFLVVLSIFKALLFIKKTKPVAVIGVGGYVSFPTCLAAKLLRIPIYLQEQNLSVGIANRILGKLAFRIFLGFKGAEKYFNPKKCIVTGNPLRKEFFSASFPSYDANRNCLLVLGGSQGAQSINEALISLLESLFLAFPNIKILHQTGERNFDQIKSKVGTKYSPWYDYFPFTLNIADLFPKASLVLSRAGALSVTEIIQVGCPAIFVPFPRKGQNDQVDNALYLEKAGVARVIQQGENFTQRLEQSLLSTFKPEILKSMAFSYSKLRSGQATATICDQIERDIKMSDINV